MCCTADLTRADVQVQDQFLKAKLAPSELLRLSNQAITEVLGNSPELGPQELRDSFAIPRRGSVARRLSTIPTVDRPKVVEYRKLQNRCCNICLSVTATVAFLVVLIYVTIRIDEDQVMFDPCYIQIRSDDPTTLKAQQKSTQKFSKFFGYDYKLNEFDNKHFHNFSKPYPTCRTALERLERALPDGTAQQYTLQNITERRLDLVVDLGDLVDQNDLVAPICMCCNSNSKPKSVKEADGNVCNLSWRNTGQSSDNKPSLNCPHVGTCCDRSNLIEPNEALKENCAICNVYHPCDQKYCAARPVDIRNAQHNPMIIGLLVSLFSNMYVIKSYLFDDKLRKATITTLLMWASLVELLFCICMLAQELSFRIPNAPCLENIHSNCEAPSSIYSWPTWSNVENTWAQTHRSTDTRAEGGRGGAINHCKLMSFIFQLSWTASDNYYFMISIDLLMNMYSTPFGSTKKRLWWYHSITLTLAFGFAFALLASGDWGVSHDTLLEDFCWNVNFGRPSTNDKHTSYWPWFMDLVYWMSITYCECFLPPSLSKILVLVSP